MGTEAKRTAVLKPHRSGKRIPAPHLRSSCWGHGSCLTWVVAKVMQVSVQSKVLPFHSCQHKGLSSLPLIMSWGLTAVFWLVHGFLQNLALLTFLYLTLMLFWRWGLNVYLAWPGTWKGEQVSLELFPLTTESWDWRHSSPGLDFLSPSLLSIFNLSLHIFWAAWLLKWCLVPH